MNLTSIPSNNVLKRAAKHACLCKNFSIFAVETASPSSQADGGERSTNTKERTTQNITLAGLRQKSRSINCGELTPPARQVRPFSPPIILPIPGTQTHCYCKVAQKLARRSVLMVTGGSTLLFTLIYTRTHTHTYTHTHFPMASSCLPGTSSAKRGAARFLLTWKVEEQGTQNRKKINDCPCWWDRTRK